MMPLIKAAVFLVDVLFGLYIFLLMLRILLQWARIDFYHPVSQFLLMVTSPPLRPLQRVIPNWLGINLAAVALMFALQICKRVITHGLLGLTLNPLGLVVLAFADLLTLLLYLFIFSILFQAIMSWVQAYQGGYSRNELTVFLQRLNEPLLRPVRRRLPPVSGMDLSPLAVIIALQLMIILVAEPLAEIGARL